MKKQKNENFNPWKSILSFLMASLAGLLGYNTFPETVANIGVMIVAVMGLTQLFKQFAGGNDPENPNPFVQVVSWIIGILYALVAFFLEAGMFAEFDIWFTLLTGIAVSMISNSFYDSQIIQDIWRILKMIFQSNSNK